MMIETTYTIYHADGTIQRGEVDWPDSPGVELIAALVEPIVGHPMEHVTVLDPVMSHAEEVSRNDYRDMFVDELGHIRAGGPKQRNHAATAIYRANWLRAEGGDPEDLHWIVGTAVLFDRIIWK
jgi:hypothetical protein